MPYAKGHIYRLPNVNNNNFVIVFINEIFYGISEKNRANYNGWSWPLE